MPLKVIETTEIPSNVPVSPERMAELQRQQVEAENLLLQSPPTLPWLWQRLREKRYRKILKTYFPIASSKKINHVAKVLAKG